MDRDTIAEVPYSTMLDWATYRTVDRQRRRDAAIRLVTAEGLAGSQRHELDVLRTAMQAQANDIASLRSALGDERAARMKEHDRAERMRGWATVGKVGVAVVGLGALAGTYIAIKR